MLLSETYLAGFTPFWNLKVKPRSMKTWTSGSRMYNNLKLAFFSIFKNDISGIKHDSHKLYHIIVFCLFVFLSFSSWNTAFTTCFFWVFFLIFKALTNSSVCYNYSVLIIVIAEISEQGRVTKNRSRSDAGFKQSPHYHINQPGGRTLPDLTLHYLQCQRVGQKQPCNQRLLVELTFSLTFQQSGKTPTRQDVTYLNLKT